LSLWLVLLSTLLTPICVLVSWKHIDPSRQGILRVPDSAGVGLIAFSSRWTCFLFFTFWGNFDGADVLS